MESSISSYDSSSSTNDGIVEDNVDSNDGTDSNCSDDGNISDSNDRVKGRGPENPSKERATAAQKSSHCEHKRESHCGWEWLLSTFLFDSIYLVLCRLGPE